MVSVFKYSIGSIEAFAVASEMFVPLDDPFGLVKDFRILFQQLLIFFP